MHPKVLAYHLNIIAVRSIRYVRLNPQRENLPEQHWSFVTSYAA
jgi:hypothetical protein